MIVNTQVAEEVAQIFTELYEKHFPIEKIRLIDEYGASDNKSMDDNNSSSFCCRKVTGSTTKISKHTLGLAIDINPLQNPYVNKSIILPKKGICYLERTPGVRGLIVKNDVCYNAFTSKGWTWGGDWFPIKGYVDFQHFEKELAETPQH
jgi:hypothetical protein